MSANNGVSNMLTERQRMILLAIVDNYIYSAEPVGSRTISKRENIGFSSATIRNEMADLEELGYLEQPHTSAGRIPSNKGYRFYVDQLVGNPMRNARDAGKFRQLFADQFFEFEQVMNHAASLLSGMTNYTSIVLGQEINNSRLKSFQMLPLNGQSAVVIMVTDKGKVESKTVSLPEGISADDLQKVVNLLNTRLQGVPMAELRRRLHSEVTEEIQRYMQEYEELLTVLEETVTREEDERLILKGVTNILMQPEFRDVDKVREILTLFEKNELMFRLFGSRKNGIEVRIGTENDEQAVNQCSIITATYHLHGQPVGTLGILGPTRMEYGKVIGILDILSNNISRVLQNIYKE